MPVPGERRSEVGGRRQADAPDARRRLIRRQHRHVEASLHGDHLAAADALDEGAVLRAAAHEDVLAVVHQQAVAPERPRAAAQASAPLDQRDGRAGVGGVERRGDARQPAAHHDDPTPAAR